MAEKKIYEGQQLTLQLNTYIDLTPEVGNTAYLILDPNGIQTQIDTFIFGDPTQGVMSYTFSVGYLIAGDYRVQTYLKLQEMAGTTFVFHVYERFY